MAKKIQCLIILERSHGKKAACMMHLFIFIIIILEVDTWSKKAACKLLKQKIYRNFKVDENDAL